MMQDITWCPKDDCERTDCKRNSKNLEHPEYLHSIFMEIPKEYCLLIKEQNQNGSKQKTSESSRA